MKRIAVYCGSSKGVRPEYSAAAEQLGAHLAREKIELVYGGGKVGLMGIVANTVLKNGGHGSCIYFSTTRKAKAFSARNIARCCWSRTRRKRCWNACGISGRRWNQNGCNSSFLTCRIVAAKKGLRAPWPLI